MIAKTLPPRFAKMAQPLAVLLLAALLISACQPASASTPPPPTLPPAAAPTAQPTSEPTLAPTAEPTSAPAALPTVAPTATVEATPIPAFTEPTLSVLSHPTLGDILVGDNGMTLYIFTQDEPGKSNCIGECLDFWPPLLTQGSPSLGPGIDPALVGTAALADGSLIVTYNQMPLYYWYLDAQPGDASGIGVNDAWYAVSPTGALVQLPPATRPTYAPSKKEKEKDDNGGYGSDY
jgi:predicted lipoprotein with Yx(FWY)xxD motif